MCCVQLNQPKVLSLVVENVGSITHNIKSVYQVTACPPARELNQQDGRTATLQCVQCCM